MRTEAARRGVDLLVLVDRSGSMGRLADTVVSEVNQVIDTVTGDDPAALVTIVAFNGSDPFDVLVDRTGGLRATKLSRHSYRPKGNTPLHDAIGHALRWLDDRTDRPDREAADERTVQFTVVTDGRENASRLFTAVEVAGMITQRRARGWEFCCLGVADAMHDARQLGFQRGEIELWEASHEGTRRAFTSISDRAMRARPRRRRQVSDSGASRPAEPVRPGVRRFDDGGASESKREEA